MKKTLYLHIGTSKTGTTAIQRFLHRRDEELAGLGILVPKTGRTDAGNHSLLARNLLQSQSTGKPPHLWGRCLNEIKQSNAHTVVMSGEMFYPLQKPFWKMAKDLKKVFSDIKVICYLRRQDEYLVSSYTQGVKMGRVETGFTEYMDTVMKGPKFRNYMYAKRLKKWSKAFGEDNIIVRPFEVGQLARGDVVADFCKLCGFPQSMMPLKSSPKKKSNTSPGEKVVQAMLYARSLMPPLPKYPESRRVVTMLVMMADRLCEEWEDKPFRGFSSDDAQAFLNRFRKGNQEVARIYLKRDSGHLFHPAQEADAKAASLDVVLTDKERAYVQQLVKEGLERVAKASAEGKPLAAV